MYTQELDVFSLWVMVFRVLSIPCAVFALYTLAGYDMWAVIAGVTLLFTGSTFGTWAITWLTDHT